MSVEQSCGERCISDYESVEVTDMKAVSTLPCHGHRLVLQTKPHSAKGVGGGGGGVGGWEDLGTCV